MTRATMKIADIIAKSGNKRHRQDYGDIDGLAESITTVGLLHPVVVNSDGKLIAGARRILAANQLGWTEIPVTVVDLENIVEGEFAENTHRKDFTITEAVEIKRALEPLEKDKAKERQGTRTDLHPGKLPTGSEGRAGDKAAKATGKTRRTLEKAEAVMKAAEADPERFGDLAKRLDEEGARVDPIHREMLKRQKPPEPEPTAPPPPTVKIETDDHGVVRAPEYQVETPAPGPASKPQGDGPYSAGECDRLRARVDALNDEKRLLEIKITALENEVKEAKPQLSIEEHFAALIDLLLKEDPDAVQQHLYVFQRDLNAAHKARGKKRNAEQQQQHEALQEVAADIAQAFRK